MEALLKELCSKHGLTTIGVNLFTEAQIQPVLVYLHWTDINGCCSGGGNTFDEAFSRALSTMAERRTARAA